MKNLLSPIFRLIKRQPLRVIPLGMINVPIDAPRALPPQRHRPLPRQVFKVGDNQLRTNQLSS
jgi:hypothetical protein